MNGDLWTYEGPWHTGRDGGAHTGGSADQCPDCLRQRPILVFTDDHEECDKRYNALRARIDALADERERLAARAEAWDEGAEFMAAQEGIAPDRDRNPYREATS